MKISQYIFVFYISLHCLNVFGQDAMFSIFRNNDTYLNPANTFNHFIEEESILKLNLHFRDQWKSIGEGDTYTAVKIQGDYNFYKSNVDGFNGGLVFLNDRSSNGGLVNSGLQLLGSYTRKLSDFGQSYGSHVITVGSSVTFAQTRTELDKLWFGRQFNLNLNQRDLTLSSGEELRLESANYTDINIGGRWMYIEDKNNFYMLGLSLSHMNNPTLGPLNTSFSLPTRLLIQAEASFEMTEVFNHLPSLLFVTQGPFWQLRPTYHVSIDINNDDNSFALLSGISTRITNSIDAIIVDAVIFDIGLNSSSWNFDFSFDLNISSLKTYTSRNGAIEISFGYILNSN